jgi:hypothetical protein
MGDMQGIPDTFDLLGTSDLGVHWSDLLQSAGSDIVTRPRVPSPPGGPERASAGVDGLLPGSALSPTTGSLWLTTYNDDFGGVSFAATGDGGLQWSQNTYPGQSPAVRSPLPQDGWTSTAAFSPTSALALFNGPRNKAGVESSALYGTNDGGAHWGLAKVFSWPSTEG